MDLPRWILDHQQKHGVCQLLASTSVYLTTRPHSSSFADQSSIFGQSALHSTENKHSRSMFLKAQLSKAQPICVFEGSAEQSMVFTLILKAQPSKAWYLLCSLAQSTWLFEVTAILKAQSSKAGYSLCSARRISSFRSFFFRVERRT